MSNEAALLGSIDERLRQLVALTARELTEGLNQKEQVEKLGRVGLDSGSISEIMGYPATTVSPILSRMRSPSRRK